MLNLELYRTFRAIYREGSLTRAARTLRMTQPGVSQQLQSLENYVGRRLFERERRGVKPTEAAKLLYAQIIGPLESLEGVEARLRRSEESRRLSLTLGAPRDWFAARLADHVHELKCDVQLAFGLTDELLERLRRDELLAVVATRKPTHAELESVPLFDERLILVASNKLDCSGFPAGRARGGARMETREKWLSAQTWFAFSHDLSLIRRFWKANFDRRPNLRPALVIPDLRLLLRALRRDAALGVFPEYLFLDLPARSGLARLWPEAIAPGNSVYLAWRKDRSERPELARLRALLRRIHAPDGMAPGEP